MNRTTVEERNWFSEQQLKEIPNEIERESNAIDACAAVLGAWHWKDPSFQPKWLFSAIKPIIVVK